MKIDKRPIVPGRIRRVPREGWSWIDRRFLRHHASELSGEAITLYFFLAAVSDKHGVSFYGDDTTAALLRLDLRHVQRAREELEGHDLVAHRHPLTQVLSLPQRRTTSSHGAPTRLGDIMHNIAERTTEKTFRNAVSGAGSVWSAGPFQHRCLAGVSRISDTHPVFVVPPVVICVLPRESRPRW